MGHGVHYWGWRERVGVMATALFNAIEVNLVTGKFSYPKLEGFEINMEKVYSTFELFLPHCGGNVEMALKQAIHQQLIAHKGMAPIKAMMKR